MDSASSMGVSCSSINVFESDDSCASPKLVTCRSHACPRLLRLRRSCSDSPNLQAALTVCGALRVLPLRKCKRTTTTAIPRKRTQQQVTTLHHITERTGFDEARLE